MFALPLLAWRLTAFSAELLLFVTHIKVLMCVGKPYSSAELSSKRWTYFLFDAVSPWNSLAAILAGNSSMLTESSEAAALLRLLVLTAVGHGALHLYYIATWNRKHAGNVIKMSAVSDMCSRWQRFSPAEVAWFLAGTTYDIITHAAIAGLLAATVMQAPGASGWQPLAH